MKITLQRAKNGNSNLLTKGIDLMLIAMQIHFGKHTENVIPLYPINVELIVATGTSFQ